MSRRDDAVQLLDHYITLVMSKAGLKVNSDTHAELADCVDAIIDASVEKLQERLTATVRAAIADAEKSS